jgi:uncharacterized protein with NAD-binding domain and iron-sulfur cluster
VVKKTLVQHSWLIPLKRKAVPVQPDFDVVWCRGTVGEMIFKPWVAAMQDSGCRFLSNKRVTDLELDEATGSVTGVLCGEEHFPADAVIFSVGISAMQKIVPNRYP